MASNPSRYATVSAALTQAAGAGGILTVTNTSSAPTAPSTELIANAAADNTLGIEVTADSNFRFTIDSNGKEAWGPGNAVSDTNLYRSAANVLTTDNGLQIGGASGPTFGDPMAEDMAFVGWAFDPIGCIGTGSVLTTAWICYLIKIPIRVPKTVTGIRQYLTAAGSGLVVNECFTWLLSSAGALLGQSADQSTNWAGSAGIVDMVLAVGTTTVAAGSNGGTISGIAAWGTPGAGQLAVASTAGFPTAGTIYVATSNTIAQVTYTGTSGGNTLTGCAYVNGSAAGTVATGNSVVLATAAASPPSVSPPFVYVVQLFNGTTGPTLSKGTAALSTAQIVGKSAAASYRWASNTSGVLLPKALTLSSNAAGALPIWAALY